MLVNPPDCGQHTLTSTLTPWIAARSRLPGRHGRASRPTTSRPRTTERAPPAPTRSRSTRRSAARRRRSMRGAKSSLSLNLSAPDRDQLVKTLKTSLPQGLVGALPGISLCSINDAGGGTCDDGEQGRDGDDTQSAPATTRCRCLARSISPSRFSRVTPRRFRSSCRQRRDRSTSATSSSAPGSSCAPTSVSTSCWWTTCRRSSRAYRFACARPT